MLQAYRTSDRINSTKVGAVLTFPFQRKNPLPLGPVTHEGACVKAKQASTDYSWVVSNLTTVNWDDWCTVCSDPSDVAMDDRFLTALDDSMGDVADTQYLIGYSKDKQPVACVCLSHFLIDGSILTGPWHRPGTNFIRRLFPRYLMFRVLFCGLPVSIGCSNLRIAEGLEREPVVDSLQKEIDRIAADLGSLLVVWKEFTDEECHGLQELTSHGYLRADSLPMNTFECTHDNFEEFCGTLRSHYRYKVRRSRKKFDKSGLRIEHISDPKRIQELYTPEVHQLYLAVLDHAEARLETLPRQFFLNLASMLSEEISFTAVFNDDQVVAFAWGLHLGDEYRNIFVGFDYSLNRHTDLYFNMMMSDLDYGIRSGATHVFMGQSAYEFKSRLGCYPQPLSTYIKARPKALNWIARMTSGLIFSSRKGEKSRNLLKATTKEREPVEAESMIC